jgi:hypothetical protein
LVRIETVEFIETIYFVKYQQVRMKGELNGKEI